MFSSYMEEKDTERKAREIFAAADTDRDGALDSDEFRAWVKTIGVAEEDAMSFFAFAGEPLPRRSRLRNKRPRQNPPNQNLAKRNAA